MVIPFSKLGAKWITLEKRVSKIGEKEAGRWGDKKFREEVGKKLAEKAPERVEESDKLREELQEMRKFLDDRIILELWSGLRLRRYGTLFIILAVLLSGFLIALVCYPEFGCLFYDCVAAGKGVKKHSIIGMVVAGALGALVSALANAAGSGDESAPPLADVSLVRDDLMLIAGAVRLGRRTMRIIRWNLLWAFGYNVLAVPAAAGLLPIPVNPSAAAAAMALSSVLVVSNSLRIAR